MCVAQKKILLLDEAYSFGSKMNTDTYSKECLDCLNRELTEHPDSFICFICGYEDQLEESFFSVNPGLKDRFPRRLTIDPYGPTELHEIFIQNLNRQKLIPICCNVEPSNVSKPVDNNDLCPTRTRKRKFSSAAMSHPCQVEWWESNVKHFPSFGRSIDSFIKQIKEVHAVRVFGTTATKRHLTQLDFERGFREYIKNETNQDKKQRTNEEWFRTTFLL